MGGNSSGRGNCGTISPFLKWWNEKSQIDPFGAVIRRSSNSKNNFVSRENDTHFLTFSRIVLLADESDQFLFGGRTKTRHFCQRQLGIKYYQCYDYRNLLEKKRAMFVLEEMKNLNFLELSNNREKNNSTAIIKTRTKSKNVRTKKTCWKKNTSRNCRKDTGWRRGGSGKSNWELTFVIFIFSSVYYDPFLAAHAATQDPNYRLQVRHEIFTDFPPEIVAGALFPGGSKRRRMSF